jgi:hypothetical protein
MAYSRIVAVLTATALCMFITPALATDWTTVTCVSLVQHGAMADINRLAKEESMTPASTSSPYSATGMGMKGEASMDGETVID